MPRSAIDTAAADVVLPLEKIFEAFQRFVQTQPKLAEGVEQEELESDTRRLLQKLFAQLRTRTGRDFSSYKRSTILRRIQRRMQMHQIEELPDYFRVLEEQPDEVRILADDLLITVTSFFRDPEVYQRLEEKIIPQLFDGKRAEDEIRAWSVGCATGEETYSLAMLLMEEAARQESPPRIKVFASDLHEHSLQRAREGLYPGDIETDVAPERLRRFFSKESGGYRIAKQLREMVIFAPHNLLGDPPISRLDLIACRNVLIYIQRSLHPLITDIFHYALRSGGFLVLGTAESVDTSDDLFQYEDKKYSIYRKRKVRSSDLRLPNFPMMRGRLPGEAGRLERVGDVVHYGALHQQMVEQYAPPSILVSPVDKVVHISEHAGRYLIRPGGELTANVFKLVREELAIELRALLDAARHQDEHEFKNLGRRVMLLNGRRLDHLRLILLGIYDITERHRAECALRESEERFRVFVEAAFQATWETNADGSAIADSPSWRAYTGQSLEEWLGGGWIDAVHPDDREYAEQQWCEAVAEGRTVNVEFRIRSPSGDWRWTNARAAPTVESASESE